MLLCLHFSGIINAQTSALVKGKIVDENGEPLIGVVIMEDKNLSNGITTDIDGMFRITMKNPNNKLLIKYLGYHAKEVFALEKPDLGTIQLELDTRKLEEVVVVGYGLQKRITNTGSVSAIQAEEIKTVPTSSIQNTLVGRLPGFFSQQRSGQPGQDAADFFIRGVNSLNGDATPLIVVDDVEYEYSQLAQLSANEIESITLLKDAATTAIYGLRGANGVLVVTTTRGKIGKPRINVTAETGISRVIRMPSYLDSYTTAMLRNEATINDSYGLSTPLVIPFTENDLKLFRDGSDPYGHPNVNWVDELLNRQSSQSRYVIDVSGGNEKIKYYTSLGFYNQNGILKYFEPTLATDDVDNNYYYKRYNFRSNLDISPIKTLKLRFDVNGRFETVNNPGGIHNSRGLFEELNKYAYLAPYAMPLRNPDGSYGYSSHMDGNSVVNPVSRLANGGYKREFRNNFNIIIGADQRLDFITPGLSAKVNVSYAGNYNENRNLTRDLNALPAWKYDSETGNYLIRNAANYRLPIYNLAYSNGTFNNAITIQGMLNFDQTFNGGHRVYGLVLVNQQSKEDKEKLKKNYRGFTFRGGYDYKQKYLVEFNLARNGNDRFRKDKRYGIFPAVSVGWNIAEENFFKDAAPIFDLLKIRGSYGIVGSDVSYQNTYGDKVEEEIKYTVGSNYYGSTTAEGSLVNPFVTWEKERKTDIGVDINLLKGKLTLTADYFYNFRYDQLISQGDVPLIIGQSLPKKNMGETENRGFDGMLNYKDKVGSVNVGVGFNISYAKNRIIYVSEAPDYPYQAQTGSKIGLKQGYQCIGFYQLNDFDENGNVKSDIAKPSWSVIQPGDLKYADMNKDGIINEADKTFLSKPNLPTTTYGLELSAGYYNFSLRALWQGAFDYAVYIYAEGSDAFNSNLIPWHLDRWTPQTAFTATYPRLGLDTNVNNISWKTESDFWMHDASYIRLKSLELAYQVPSEWLRSKQPYIGAVRLYLTGYNILNFTHMGKFQQDAEVANGTGNAYPNTANYNIGIQIAF
ncbi:TonB-dependent receptor SusC [termite gut metagenome]|uniref:TonB-dependent receptor SusC n=1 Tax=termite gut metagenome TaxID=433724 RepID=A0A5J4SVH4_9ZZZZ